MIMIITLFCLPLFPSRAAAGLLHSLYLTLNCSCHCPPGMFLCPIRSRSKPEVKVGGRSSQTQPSLYVDIRCLPSPPFVGACLVSCVSGLSCRSRCPSVLLSTWYMNDKGEKRLVYRGMGKRRRNSQGVGGGSYV
ncbi:hypothetical protein QBC43DRAFT_308124, partial [Cladorrhinum sp. PSN259]